MLKIVKRLSVSILLAAAAWLVLSQLNVLPSISDLFKSKTVIIDNTPVLIKEIKQIAELTTAISYDEVVVDSVKFNNVPFIITNPLAPGLVTKDKIVLIARGKVIAGVDLKEIKEKDIFIDKDSISIRLPQPNILSSIINPSDFETFSEKGNWANAEVTLVKEKALRMIKQRAIEQNILRTAAEKAKSVLEQFLGSAGFTKVHLYN